MKSVTRSLVTVALHEAALALCEEGRPSRAAACNEALRALSADTGDEVAQLRHQLDNATACVKSLQTLLPEGYTSIPDYINALKRERDEARRDVEAAAVGEERRDRYIKELEVERDNALGAEKALNDTVDSMRQAYASLHSELEKLQAQRTELAREVTAMRDRASDSEDKSGDQDDRAQLGARVGAFEDVLELLDELIQEKPPVDSGTAATLSIIKTEDLTSELCRRMALGKPLGDYHEQAAGKEGIPGELDTVGEAKEIAREILHSAKRNGLGGCALCAS